MALRKTIQQTTRLETRPRKNQRIRIINTEYNKVNYTTKASIQDQTRIKNKLINNLNDQTQQQLDQQATGSTFKSKPKQSMNLTATTTNSKNYNTRVQLNPIELKLFHWLNQCTDYLKKSPPTKHLPPDSQSNQLEPSQATSQKDPDRLHSDDAYQSLELRIAGGWVRDKLLGVESNDLDIAISSLTGQDFARLFSNFIKIKREEKSQNPKEGDEEEEMMMGKISTIEARPDQSKHLETATAQFLGLDLDFVQLRSEDYGVENHSRIPTAVNFGTPLQDALRRDITINSLFYNIHTGFIEDHTEKGLQDLETGLIRTPLAACQTFQDDPLRLLRCIRFATRFDFQLDREIVLAAKSDPIQNALMEKVSRERVGIEVDKMLKGPNPLSSLRMIEELGLYPLVFAAPKGTDGSVKDAGEATRAARWLDFFMRQDRQHSSPITASLRHIIPPLHPNLLQLLSTPASSPLSRRLFLACALLPYRSLSVKSRNKLVPAPDLVVLDSLKFGNHDKTFISHIFKSLELIQIEQFEIILSSLGSSSNGSSSDSSSDNVRLSLGKILRSPHVHDLKMTEDNASCLVWQASFLFAVVHHFVQIESIALASSLSINDSIIQEKLVNIVHTFNRIVELISELNLTFILTPEFEKRRLDGKEICEILGIKPGKQIAKIIEKLIQQQILFPNLNKKEASIWLKNFVNQFGIGSFSQL